MFDSSLPWVNDHFSEEDYATSFCDYDFDFDVPCEYWFSDKIDFLPPFGFV
jgi:hypothetical protein